MTSLYHLRSYLRLHLGAFLLGALFVLCGSGMTLLGPFVLRQAIDSLSPGPASRHSLPLGGYGLLIVAVALGAGVFSFAARWTINGASRRVEYDLRNSLFQHYQRLDLAFFQANKVGDLVARATNDLSAVRMMVGPGISNILNTTVVFVATMIAMATLDPRLTLLSGVFLPALTVIFVALSRRIERSFRRVQDQFGDLSSAAQENFSGIRVVKAYVQEEREIAAFGRANRFYVDNSMRYARLTAGLWPAMTLVAGLSVVVILWVGGNDVIAGRISVGKFVQFNAYIAALTWPMIALGWSFKLFQQGDASLRRIREVTERAPAIADRPRPSAARPIAGEIVFEDVSLSYDDRAVLRDVNLRIPAGATVALVGPTGGGKSLLMNLIPRIVDPQRGRVLVDGIDVRDWPLEALRRQIGYVTQETFLFSVPLRENVAYGVDGAAEGATDEAMMERVEAAATIAGLAGDVADFPQGFATTIGERGVTLSGGQKQRASIARAVMKDPRILLLDDALSSVDTHTEESILRGLRGVTAARTSLIVAHRISTVRDADLIVVLDDGRIAEQGPHGQLELRGGLYAAMNRRQLLSEELDGDL